MMAPLQPGSVQASDICPLSRPFIDFDANMAEIPDDVPILTLLATDDGWDWLAGHVDQLAAATATLLAATAAAEEKQWTTARFVSGSTSWALMTRGCSRDVLGAAVLEVSFGQAS